MVIKESKRRILTGDRPTGFLHLGHYVGTLENRVKLQDKYECFLIISDYEFLTDHLLETSILAGNIENLVLDYLSVGIDPEKAIIFVESQIPQISELTLLFSMIVKLSRVKRNPTIKDEIESRGISDVSYGFIGWPIAQAADILSVRANLVPVGDDQLPHIEQTREIARSFNHLFGDIFDIPEPLIGRVRRLPGLDGRKKMSKSLNNAIYLTDSPDVVRNKIMSAVTDPARIHPSDIGHPDICNIFQYHKIFNPVNADNIKEMCKKGRIGCVECKKMAAQAINKFLDPIRERRNYYVKKKKVIGEILKSGREKTIEEASKTLELVKKKMHLDYRNF